MPSTSLVRSVLLSLRSTASLNTGLRHSGHRNVIRYLHHRNPSQLLLIGLLSSDAKMIGSVTTDSKTLPPQPMCLQCLLTSISGRRGVCKEHFTGSKFLSLMLGLWTVWLFWNLTGVQGGGNTPALTGILLQPICSWNLWTRDGSHWPLFTYAYCCLNHPLASPIWNEYWERRLLAVNSFNRTILLSGCRAYRAHGWEKWSSLLIPLAADTPVYPGGAVAFTRP